MIKISIIVPVYNAEANIEKCINSILNQTYQDFELILINDGSKDNSLKVIKKYETNSKIKIIDQKNHGVAYTRNLGVKKASGKYIMFIDNDDYIDNDYLERHINLVENKDVDLVISGYRRVNVDNKILFEEKLENTYWSRYIVTAPWAKIYRKDFLVENNVEFLSYGIGEDVYFNLVLYSYNPRIFITNYVGYNWYFNTKSVSNTSQKGLNKDVDILVLLNKIIEKYDELNEYVCYYLIRYYIWYLLFSGRKANRYDFILEYKRIKQWYIDNNIKLKIMPWSRKIKGESLKNRLFVLIFLILERLHLITLFSIFYCKGKSL